MLADTARRWRRFTGPALFSIAIAAFFFGCGTDAHGVDSCRKIEEARCRQLPACPTYGVRSSDDVEACVRFYRDQCLHGLSGADPGGPSVDVCVRTIEQAGACAMQGESAPLSSCATPPSQQSSAPTACFLIAFPETALECSFLPPVPIPDAGSDGSGTTGGSASDGGSDASAE